MIAMVVSLCPTIAFAGDTLPYRGESALADNEPTSHGYRAEDLLSWDPATDPDAELLRARVPLQNRIEAVAATQANPSLNPEVKYLTLAGDYGNAFFGGTSYTNEFSEYCFNFWQYIDYYAPWHGQTTATTPMELWNVDDERVNPNAWKSRSFEFGMMNLPNAAYTNAAHKNGVLSLGCIFLPRAYQSWRTLIQRDENGGFPYADKLIEITKYYGFDGWYMNLEGSDSPLRHSQGGAGCLPEVPAGRGRPVRPVLQRRRQHRYPDDGRRCGRLLLQGLRLEHLRRGQRSGRSTAWMRCTAALRLAATVGTIVSPRCGRTVRLSAPLPPWALTLSMPALTRTSATVRRCAGRTMTSSG